LKIHLANVFGNNKLSFDERAQFTDDHIDEIFDSAHAPLDGERWYVSSSSYVVML
jgi:DNA-directed RNA polymerase